MALREVVSGKTYVREDLYTHQGLWHSPMHHGDFSASSMDEVLQRINRRLQQASGELDRLDFLLLTYRFLHLPSVFIFRSSCSAHQSPDSCSGDSADSRSPCRL